MRWLILLFLGYIYLNTYAQTIIPFPPTSKHLGYLEYLPPDYSSTTEKYPCIDFLHGSGKVGSGRESDIWKFASPGPFKEIRYKYIMFFTVNGEQECFIVIGPQIGDGGGFSATDFQNIYNHILNTYRFDPESIYVTGLGIGGESAYKWAASSVNSPNNITGLGIMSGTTDCKTAKVEGSRNIPIWSHHGKNEVKMVSKLILQCI